ncbi:hypothetical protein [Polyangium aurulentum]|uniref:hypothetical protein n=1 Tax=Polyangium aurulentum TaxID=2567896 RepID=UPI0010ADF02A|nr:hypothetical protein [Polyangium aurulentum]UQA58366.1 hypothetical protein E8A73_045165 [Polyangium aurulentum]
MPLSSPFTRAAGTLALVLAFVSPSRASAQQPPIPPTGEPPPPEARAQEEAAITYQTQQAYLQAHQEEFRRQAEAEVESARNAAWQERGRKLTPPAYGTRVPRPTLSVLGTLGAVGEENGWLIGVSGLVDVRIHRWWGLSTSGSYMTVGTSQPGVPGPVLRAVTSEVSGFATLAKSGLFIDADRMMLRVGHQLAFPVGAPNVKRVYLGPYLGVGGSFAVGQLGRKTYWAFVYESKIGYRWGLGPGDDSLLQGVIVDFNVGVGLGFQ